MNNNLLFLCLAFGVLILSTVAICVAPLINKGGHMKKLSYFLIKYFIICQNHIIKAFLIKEVYILSLLVYIF